LIGSAGVVGAELLVQPVSHDGSQAKRLRNRRCNRPSRQLSLQVVGQGVAVVLQVSWQLQVSDENDCCEERCGR